MKLKFVAGQDQKIDSSSIKIQQGYYDENGTFVAEKNLPVDADVDGNKMTVHLNNISGIVNVSYHTKNEHVGTLTNTVTEHKDLQEDVTASTNWSDNTSSSSAVSSSSNKKNGIVDVVANNNHSNHQNGNRKGNSVGHNNGISKGLSATGKAKTNTMLLTVIALLTIATGVIIKQRRN